jgi:hypothetical protein
MGLRVGAALETPGLISVLAVGCGHMMVDGVSPNGLRPLGL